MKETTYKIKTYKKDSIIYLEKTKALPYLFIIKSGKVHRTINFLESDETETLSEGDNFGFVNCLTGANNFERITALTDCEVILIDKKCIIPFLSQKKEIFIKIIKDYSNRLRNLDSMYNQLLSISQKKSSINLILQAVDFFEKSNDIEKMNYSYNIYANESNNLNAFSNKKYKKVQLQKFNASDKIKLKKDQIVFLEGESGDYFFYIEKGKIKISHYLTDKEIIMSILGEGEFFGEMALLNEKSRMASATVFEDCQLLVLDQKTFMDKLGDAILQKIFLSLAYRFYHTYRRVINLSYKNPLARMYDCLDYLIDIKNGIQREDSFHFYFSIDEIKRMTDTIGVDNKHLSDFLNDDNIRFSPGEMVIININKFYAKLRKFTGRSKE